MAQRAFALLQLAARRLPLFAFPLMAAGAGVIQLALSPRRAWAHQANLRHILNGRLRFRARRWGLTFKALTSFGYFLLEFFKTSCLSGAEILHSFTFRGLSELDRALANGRGVVIVTAHVGNWEAGALALASADYKLHVVAGVQFSRSFSRHVKAIKERAGIGVVFPGPGRYRRLINALRRNEVVALVVDGDAVEKGLEVPFFSGSIRAPSGPARLALLTGAAVISTHVVRTGPLKFDMEFRTLWEGGNRRGVDEGVPAFCALLARQDACGGMAEGAPRAGAGQEALRNVPCTPVGNRATDQHGVAAGSRMRGDPGFVHDLTAAIMKEQERVIGVNLDQWCIFRRLWPD